MDNDSLTKRRETFEKFINQHWYSVNALRLSSFSNRTYESNDIENMWRGFRAAWSLQTNDDKPLIPKESETVVGEETATQKATAIIEGIWDIWYGEYRGTVDPDTMNNILEEAKEKIITAIIGKWDDPDAASYEITILKGKLVEAKDIIETIKSFAEPRKETSGICSAIVEFIEGKAT